MMTGSLWVVNGHISNRAAPGSLEVYPNGVRRGRCRPGQERPDIGPDVAPGRNLSDIATAPQSARQDARQGQGERLDGLTCAPHLGRTRAPASGRGRGLGQARPHARRNGNALAPG